MHRGIRQARVLARFSFLEADVVGGVRGTFGADTGAHLGVDSCLKQNETYNYRNIFGDY